MPSSSARLITGFLLVVIVFSAGCIKRSPTNIKLELSIYEGIRDVVRLGDSQTLVEHHAGKRFKINKLGPQEEEEEQKSTSEKLGFSEVYELEEIGTTVYFRQGRVALILVQEPFRGSILGKTLKVFSFSPPANKTWEEALIREFGTPGTRATGGRFGSEALFYPWGDISYNRMGPNEIAIYRDFDIAAHRQRNFGRELILFKQR